MASDIANAYGPLSVKDDRAGLRVGSHLNILSALCRAQECLSGAVAIPIVDGSLEITRSGLIAAVVIRISWNTQSPGALNESFTDRVDQVEISNRKLAISVSTWNVLKDY